MTRAEFRWVSVASLVVLLLACLPTLWAWSLADADHVFSGFVYNTEDGNSYIAKMRLGARGEWLFHLPYSPEEHEGALVYPFYLLLGRVAKALGVSLVLAYHLARLLLGLGLLLTVYAFVAAFTPEVRIRRLAWALVAGGSGLGWLLVTLGATEWLGSLPLDFWVPEAYAFLVLYSSPHLALAELLLLWAVLWTLRASEGRGLPGCVIAGLCAFVMSWIVPFYAGVLGAVLGAYLLALTIRRRRLPWREAGWTALAGIFTLPPLTYNAWVFTSNPAFRTWAAQNRIASPHPVHYVLGYALLLVPAVWGGAHAIQSRSERWLLPVAWVLVVPFLVYIPFNLQRRMVAGAQMPLALLAAAGLVAWLDKKSLATVAFVAVASLSNLLLVAGSIASMQDRPAPVFRTAAEVAAFTWLGAHAEADDIALASVETGNALPAWTDLRVFAGHGPETLHFAEKESSLHRFFQTQTAEAWRQSLLRQSRVAYLVYGPAEQALGNWDPAGAVYLMPIYSAGGYTIYEVAETGPP